MPGYHLIEKFYLLPTAAGAFYAVSDRDSEPIRRLLLALLRHHTSPLADIEKLCRWLNMRDEQRALELLYRAQTMAWVQGNKEPKVLPDLGIGVELHDLLPHLSSVGKGLLVDSNGLSLAHTGIDDETAETLSVLSADLTAVQHRHAERLEKHLGLKTQGWGALDAYGASRIGVWPLVIGDNRLQLVLLGEPRLNQPEFITLVWALINRYGDGLDTDRA